MEIALNGIDRSNSNENGVPNAASLIINARKKGSTWEYVGDKEFIGYATVASNYLGYYWHHKFSNNLVIGYNSNTRKVDVIDIKKLVNQVSKRFINAAGTGDFTLSTEETFMSIHSLNDIIIIDTDKNKYYFVWNEEKENFEVLPDLPELSIMISYYTEEIDTKGIWYSSKIKKTLSGTNIEDKTPLEIGQILSFKDSLSELMRVFINKLKEDILDRNLIWRGFRVVAAFELSDGSIFKASNIVSFIDNFNQTSKTVFEDRNFYRQEFQYIRPESSLLMAGNKISVHEGGNIVGSDTILAYKGVKVDFLNSSLYYTLDKWISNNLLDKISIYITNPDDFFDEENIQITDIIRHPETGSISTIDINTYTPYNNEKAYNVNVPYYKIGELNIKSRDVSFEIKSDMFRNVINNESLQINQDLSRKYVSGVNMIYNGMIHKSSILNLVNSNNLIFGAIQTSFPEDYPIAVDIQVNNKWKRFLMPGHISLNTATGIASFTGLKANFQIFSPSVTRANLVFKLTPTSPWQLFKELRIDKSTFTNSLYVFPVIDFEKDPIYDANNTKYDKYREIKRNLTGRYITDNTIKDFRIYEYSLDFEVQTSVLNSMPSTNYKLVDDLSYEDTNRLQLSATNNPFIYPAERSYRFGSENNKVIASESSTVQLSDTKFGQLPLYVFSKQGIWIGETAQGDIAYNSFHLIDNLECFDNPKLIQRVLGGVVFGAINGIYVISNTTLRRLSQGLDGRVVPRDVDGIEQRITGLNITQACTRIDDLMKDYLSDNSFCVFDKKENELLFVEPDKDFSFVLQLDDMSWTTRKDGHRNAIVNGSTIYTNGTITQFMDSVIIDNEYKLIGRDNSLNRDLFFNTEETDRSKTAGWNFINNNAVVFISGVIMNNQYVKLEHIISRFSQLTNTDFDSYILLAGSRDGIEWKVLNHSSMVNVPKNLSGQEMRRCFTSARYFQIVYIRIERNNQNTEPRKQSYFERFSFDMSNSDAVWKLR